MLFSLDTFTILACWCILVAFFVAWIYVANTKIDDLPKKRKWIEQLPSIISTLGVLGTFLGITRGLMSFDTAILDQSIPILLNGLKTAFFTSLLGMSGSLILNRIVSAKFDKESKSSEIEKAARMIIDAINANQRQLPRFLEDANKNFVSILSQDNTVQIIRQDVEQLKDDVEALKGINQELNSALGEIAQSLNNLSSSNNAIAEELPRLRAVAVTATASISAIDNNVEDISGTISSLDSSTTEIKENYESDMEEFKVTLKSISGCSEEIRDTVNEIQTNGEAY